ncbi:MAG: hypothetical protein AAF433_03015 [Bacteroidota bacterium]
MKKIYLSLLLTLGSSCLLMAQRATELDGEWEGYLTMGGLQDGQSTRIQLQIERSGRWQVVGQTYVIQADGRVQQMDIRGRIYQDFSMRLWEVEPETEGVEAAYKRQYQLIFKPDFSNATLNGYWQEISPYPTAEGLERGRVLLRPKSQSGA